MARRMITYPTGRLLAVVDTPDAAAAATAELLASGTAQGTVDVLAGDAGRDRLGRLGATPNALSRAVRVVQFLLMDQMPDFLVYEAALLEGRAVVAVRLRDREAMRLAAAVLERHGAHFLNWFGRFVTEEVSLWRGREPEIPDALRR